MFALFRKLKRAPSLDGARARMAVRVYCGMRVAACSMLALLLLGGGSMAHAQSGSMPLITVSAPFAGAEWMQGKQYQIMWAQQYTERVDIGWGACEACTAWLATTMGVDANVATGFYNWTVPEDAKTGDAYRITVIGRKGDTAAAPVTSGIFKIVENPELMPDLLVESVQIGTRAADTQVFREQELSDKDDGWARLWVVNRGRRPSGEWNYAVSVAGEAGSFQSLKYRSLNAGEGIEVFSHLGIRNAGSLDVLFFVDPGSERFELNEGNNGLRKAFLIKETGTKPDLALVTVAAQTDKDGVISELAMTTRAKNLLPLGDPVVVRVKAPSLNREFRRDYARTMFSTQNTVLGLPGSPWPAGNYLVEVMLDPDTRIDEESEANNTLLTAVVMGHYVGFPATAQETGRVTPPFVTVAPPVPPASASLPVSQIIPAAPNAALIQRLKGEILLQAEGRGELWYVDPVSGGRWYLGTGEAAMRVLRAKGLGIATRDLEKISVGISTRLQGADEDGDGLEDSFEEAIGTDPRNADTDGDGFGDATEAQSGYSPRGAGKSAIDARLAARLEGRIVLQVHGRGQAWYIHKGRRYYLKGGEMTVEILKQFMLGVRNSDLAQIPSAE